MQHSLRRTSPKGQAFVGTCVNCGLSGITSKQFLSEECENIRDVTREQALLEAIDPTLAFARNALKGKEPGNASD